LRRGFLDGGRRHDAGLLFVSYQRDPRIGYIKILRRMIQCTTHIGGGVFACPGGVAEDEFIYRRRRRGMSGFADTVEKAVKYSL
jgi:Dyp-type peroxidase family